MLKQIILSISFFICINSYTYAQSNWCLRGQVIDANTNESIPGAYIATIDLKNAAPSNKTGQFKLCHLKSDSVKLIVSHTSYNAIYPTIIKNKKAIIFKLTPKDYKTQEVTVTAQRSNLVKSYVPGKLSLNSEDILLSPALLGAPDVIKTLQLLPGIQSVNEGNSGIYVRGGSPGQNYVVFDGIELMNPSHIMGIFSVFNPNLTNSVDFYKGNAPVHQSMRLASSIIVSTKDEKSEGYNWSGNIGNISSNLSYHGQSKNKRWFFSSGIRRSYIELLKFATKPLLSDENNYFDNNNYYFFDFNGKVKYQTRKDKVQFTWYYGNDKFSMTNPSINFNGNSNWSNAGASLLWNRKLSDTSGFNTGFDYTSYYSYFSTTMNNELMYFKTRLNQLQHKLDYYKQANKHLFRIGSRIKYGEYTPQDIKYNIQSVPISQTDNYNNLSTQIYFSNHYSISEKWDAYFGLRYEHYGLIDNNSSSLLKEQSNHINSVITLSYFINKQTSIKASHAYTAQNIHLASMASIPLPTDVWMPATERLPHEKGHQATIGIFKDLAQSKYEFGIEFYGKSIDNQLLLNPNIDGDESLHFEDNFFIGKGLGYGAEFLFKKNRGKTRATLSYTLGQMKQQFPNMNSGEWFNAKYDRRHDVNIVLTHKPNKRFDYGLVFMYATGNTATLPKGRYFMMGNIANDYSSINNYRMPAYHRLDLSMNYYIESNIFHESVLNFSIINIYNRSNPYFIYFETQKGDQNYDMSINAKQSSFFPIVPSISWRYKF
ncbi:TonB-dependent receptor [Saccharicrinis aurantiacus]|uniref:TonB-dependent receptor n=1 Tax=Saccharicrinis aurantiacus TaxID=1849719 RepID=UPI002493976A|nr:TonB-dependent receptor [Saccharicrinis aurantiacus]